MVAQLEPTFPNFPSSRIVSMRVNLVHATRAAAMCAAFSQFVPEWLGVSSLASSPFPPRLAATDNPFQSLRQERSVDCGETSMLCCQSLVVAWFRDPHFLRVCGRRTTVQVPPGLQSSRMLVYLIEVFGLK